MCFTVDYNDDNREKMDSTNAVLDLSVKPNADSDHSHSLFEGKSHKEFSKEPTPQPTENKRKFESSAMINTPPHESEIPAKTQGLYNLPSGFSPSLDMEIYPRIIADQPIHHDNRLPLLPPPFMQHYPAVPKDPTAPAIVPYAFPLSTIPMPTPELASKPPGNAAKPPKKTLTATRPFKVYPNVPAFGNDSVDHIMKELDQERYEEYRDKVLKTVELNNNKGTNVKMRRENKNCSPTSTMQDKDEAYLEKRKKNNAAAKRSRDARKRKEDEIAIRAAYLENKVTVLTQLLKKVQNENEALRHYRDIVHRLNIEHRLNLNIASFS